MTGTQIAETFQKIIERQPALQGADLGIDDQFVWVRVRPEGHFPPARHSDLLRLNSQLPHVKVVLEPSRGINLLCEFPREGVTEEALETLAQLTDTAVKAFRRVQEGRPVASPAAQGEARKGPDVAWISDCLREEGWEVHEEDAGWTACLKGRDTLSPRISIVVEEDVALRLPILPLPSDRDRAEALYVWMLMVGDHLHLVKGVLDEKGLGLEVRLDPALCSPAVLRHSAYALSVACRLCADECRALLQPSVAEAFLAFHHKTCIPHRKEG